VKQARVRIGWTRSASADVTSREIEITKNGETTVVSIGPEAESYELDIVAMSAVNVRTKVYDAEGNFMYSETYTVALGDLEAPAPDTEFFHEILSVVDVPDSPVA